MDNKELKINKGNPWALLPIGVFLVLYIGLGVIFGDFYKMSVVVAFLVAILVACIQHRGVSFDEKLGIMAKGLADKNITTMILIFLASGIFAGILGRDSASSVADLFLSFIPAQYSALVLFIVSCFVSTAMGTSCGTITVLTPIACSLSDSTGISLALCVGSVIGGSMFGDNLSFISDTTIAATTTQGCKMKDKFKENFFIALPAALVTVIILFIFALTASEVNAYTPESPNLWLLIPYVLVLIGGIVGINVFIVLLAGIGSAFVIKLCLGIEFVEIVGSMGSGAGGMFEVILVTMLVTMLSGIMRHFGGFNALLYLVKRTFKGKVGGQLGIGALVSAMDIATANNTVAIVMAAPIAKNISEEYGITNTKTASILDIFGSVVQGILPYGAQMITAISLVTIAYNDGDILSVVSAVDVIPYLFYPFLLAVSAIVFAFFPSFGVKEKKKEISE
ncbi:MAG: Na+/H+ antiporter NhaC family protein [Clostridia bacterium]|nr:Na+/H+ antiporter NhaC family protein [Clostridia bacterium]